MANKFTMKVYNPAGTIQVTNVHAPRLDSLNGKTIGELANGAFEYQRTFPVVREALRKRFPNAKFIPYSEFPLGKIGIDADGIGEIVKAKGCDAVIVGNAA